jgi:16S rRNA (cytosine1402-N4)-methyltransferase
MADTGSLPAPAPKAPHVPVLLAQILEQLGTPPPPGHSGQRVFLDGTLGAGGHSAALLAAHPDLRLIGLDRDQAALTAARARLAPFADRITLRHARFSEARAVLNDLSIPAVDLALFDLGVSSMQIDGAHPGADETPDPTGPNPDDPADADPDLQTGQGISFSTDAPLDMRMGLAEETAADLMDRLDVEDLANLLFLYGGERLSRRIAPLIKEWRADGSLQTTADLARLCYICYPRKHHRIHPATRTFQALRIAVNDEIGELTRLLESLPKILAPGARVAVISFHSLEDGAVKRAFQSWKHAGLAQTLTKKPLTADEAEVRHNRRARSAKLRVSQWR